MKIKQIDERLKDLFYGDECGVIWVFIAVVVVVCLSALDYI